MTPVFKKLLPLHFALTSFGALICLIWLLFIPGDAKNAIIGSYSASRLGLAAVLLAGLLISARLAFPRNETLDRLDAHFSRMNNVFPWLIPAECFISILMLLTGTGFLLLPSARLGDFQYAFARIKPLVAWVTLLGFQAFLLSVQGFLLSHPSALSAVKRHVSGRSANLQHDRQFYLALIIGGVCGVGLGLLLHSTGREIFNQVPWLPWAILAFSLSLLIFGLLYHPALVNWLPYGFAALIVFGIVVNLWTGPSDARRFKAQFEPLAQPDAVTLANRYHYSYSVYHVLSLMYPNSPMEVSPGLLQSWNLDESQLKAWVPVTQVIEQPYSPSLTPAEAQQIIDQKPTEVEINTIEGTRYYYFLPRQDGDFSPILLLSGDDQRFFLPLSQYQQLFPQRGAIR